MHKLKVEYLKIVNFKKFRDLEIDFKNKATDEIADEFLILGDNGSGKTSVLQAIALCLSLASGRTRSIEDFDWLGWVPGRYQHWGKPRIELTLRFSTDEIEATKEAAQRWWRSLSDRRGEFRMPGNNSVIHLRLNGGYLENPQEELFQVQGRGYAARLLSTDPSARDLFDALPGVFWFDQFRNLATPQGTREGENGRKPEQELTERIPYAVGVARLRDYLNRWKLERISGGSARRRRDYLLELENMYRRIFPGRSFSDPEPMFEAGVPSPSNYYFMFSDGHRTYDIEEMSAGEQSVFPILYEFVRLQIRNSVVLIDEIDLNLHPPLAQALVKALLQIGPGCQFIFTTHSQAVASLVSREEIHRLPEGQLCL